ncbi:MAG: hypothetical protein J7K66_05600 [Anaerolineaceae bacterium]|nr:hypothetical protein [Anaerolineaceae bacterium]
MKNRASNYDLFKLSVVILLLLILAILLISKPKAVISNGKKDVADLKGSENVNEDQTPEFPLSDGLLTLDEEGSGLLDKNGVLRFRLSDDKQIWEPMIPDEIRNKLPDDYALISDESNLWHIINGDGDVLYSFSIEMLEWNAAPERIVEAEAALELTGDKEMMACDGANPARLTSLGSTARVVNASIPLRSSPNVDPENSMLLMPKGSILEVIKLPVCTPFLSGANLWWGVRTKSGLEGWAAEASALSDIYYLEEIK